MRLGISHVLSHETPEQWAQDLRALGLSAAVFPVEYAAGDAQIAAYADAARGAGLCIAEVGAWSNPLSEIPEQRQAALEKCKASSAWPRSWARAAASTSPGAFRGARWDGFHRANYTQEAFEATVRSIQEIIDSVKPKKTYYCMEAMQWMIPDTPQQYLDLLRAVAPRGLRRAHRHHQLGLQPQDLPLQPGVHRRGVRPAGRGRPQLPPQGLQAARRHDLPAGGGAVGLGGLDIAHYIERAEALSPDTPMIIEHLTGDAAYREAVARVQGIARAAGVAIR